MNPEELDLVSRDEAPSHETLRCIYSAISMHHLAVKAQKIREEARKKAWSAQIV